MRRWLAAMTVLMVGASAMAQTSSLYVQPTPAGTPRGDLTAQAEDRLAPDIAQTSLTAVALPPPRKFARHDLITIIVRESVENDSSATLETEKAVSVKGEVASFPHLTLADLLRGQLKAGDGDAESPKVDVKFDNSFEGEGDYSRKDTFVARITARVIDVKPNGTLVLEARKMIQSDKEEMEMIVTGTCRKEDVQSDNTVLSTQLYDLNVTKRHDGEVRRAAKKGVLTKLLDLVFNF